MMDERNLLWFSESGGRELPKEFQLKLLDQSIADAHQASRLRKQNLNVDSLQVSACVTTEYVASVFKLS